MVRFFVYLRLIVRDLRFHFGAIVHGFFCAALILQERSEMHEYALDKKRIKKYDIFYLNTLRICAL